MARSVNRGVHVEKNMIAGADEKMWIDSMAGDLIIQNLRFEDGGFYTCSSTGSKAKTIQLNVITGMFYLSCV